MKNMLLFLDDVRIPLNCAEYMYRRGVDCRIYHQNWIIVRTYEEFVNYISVNGIPDIISFDHDLESDKTGMDCAKWLINYCLDNKKILPEYMVHSMNPSGVENINGILENFKKSQNIIVP